MLVHIFFNLYKKQRILHGCAEIQNFSSSVEKSRKQVKYFQHEKRNFVSPSSHVMFYLLYKHQWNTQPFHWNGKFYPAKDAIYYVPIATVIFSHVEITCYCVKISCFRVKAHLVLIFHWCLYNKIPYTYKIFRNPTEDHFKYS